MTDIKTLQRVLHDSRTAVLAMASGGCARYIFSTEVAYHIDPEGWPVLTYESPNPFHHQLLANSGLHLIIDLEKNPDGTAHNQLVLAGKIQQLSVEGDVRKYRFAVDHAHEALESGETVAIGLKDLIRIPNRR